MRKWQITCGFLVVVILAMSVGGLSFWDKKTKEHQEEISAYLADITFYRDWLIEKEQALVIQDSKHRDGMGALTKYFEGQLFQQQTQQQTDFDSRLEDIEVELTSEYEENVTLAEKTGYEKGKKEVLVSGILLKKSTRQELIDSHFLLNNGRAGDGTLVLLPPYIPGKQVCVEFAAGLNDAAIYDGYQEGVVFLVFNYTAEGGKYGHFLNVFRTTKGLIYVEPQIREEVKVEKGKSYSRLNGFDPQPGDIVREIIIFW